ncbi:MAG: chromosomal replication initiator protein DnaA [Desulfobacteraceae bacterium]|nr:MAG: chromosomal replication initiator protein DnaA [Desulfobacteraceae bacterium]
MSSVWEEVKNQVKDCIPKKSFSLWIDPLTFLERNPQSLVLGCPNKFSLKWITENYHSLLEERVRKTLDDKDYALEFKIFTPKKAKPQLESQLVKTPEAKPQRTTLPIMVSPAKGAVGRSLNSEFTFERFVVGRCNEFAYSASKALALDNNLPYNSMFILADTGLGKSHLSQAIGHAMLSKNPNLRIHYITAEDFMNEMVAALKYNRMEEFKNKYRRACDVLLLEEVQFLSGKNKTQIELGYTLDALINDRKKIIFTSSLLPKDIPNITRELSSRFTSSVITSLTVPDFETRVKILQIKALEQKLNLAEEIIHFLAEHLSFDIRQMESALCCLRAKADLLKVKIDMDLAKEVIKSHVPEQDSIGIEIVKDLICRYFKVDPLMLRSKSRKKIYSYPRSIYIYLCRQYTPATVEEIGRSLNRKHSTILYASETIENRLKMDRKIRNQIEFLSQKLKDTHKQ